MAGERLTLNPTLDASANSPLELSGQDGSLANGLLLMAHQYPPPPRNPQWVSSADTEGEVVGNTHYGNREINLVLRCIEPTVETTGTNLATNPKCAVDTTGWTNSGLATMERKTLYGSEPDGVPGVGADTALHCVGNSDLDYAYDDISVTSGQSYTLSAYVYLLSNSATGVRLVIYNAAGAALKANTSTHATLGTSSTGWTRLTVSVTADATATWRFGVQQVGAGAADVYMTGVQIENASAATAYFDGDSPGCAWSGTHHASTSTRPATGGTRFYRILEDLQQWADRTVREGGTLMRVPPGGEPLIFDVLDAEVNVPADNRFIHSRSVEVGISLTCKPFWRGQWATLSDHTETTAPLIRGTDTISGGQVPSLGRLTIDEDQGADQWWVVAGWRSKNYTSDASNALFFEAEDLTELGATAVANGATGASPLSPGTSNVQRNTDLNTTYIALLNTQIDASNTDLSHIGAHRVFARLYRPTGNTGAVDVAFEWAEGDFRRWTRNTAVSYAVNEREGVFTIADLGMITPSKVATGTQAWQGRVLARSTVVGDEIDVDYIFLVPVDEGAGEVTVSPRVTTPTSFSAYSDFTTESGAIAGDSLTTGGTWTGAGDADDFSVAAGVATRTAVSDTATGIQTGRVIVAGTPTPSATAARVDLKFSVLVSGSGQYGITLRYTDINNFAAVYVQPKDTLCNLQIDTRASSTTTAGVSVVSLAPLVVNTTYTLYVQAIGSNVAAWLVLAGATPSAPNLVCSAPDLATLTSGKVGLFDWQTAATATTRTYDNFAAWVPPADAAVCASQSLQIREDRVIREDSAGAIWTPVTKYEGAYARLPVTGRENRTLETIVKASRNDPSTMSDGPGTTFDDISYQWQHAPRGITTPEPTT